MDTKAMDTWKIVNTKTGAWYKPNSRGFSSWKYPNEYAANQAIATMPERARSAYRAVLCGDEVATDSIPQTGRSAFDGGFEV